MALGDPYATTAELKGYLGIEDGADDARLDSALAAVSRGVEKFCARQFNDAGTASARTFPAETRCRVRVDDFHTTVGLLVATDHGDNGTYSTTWTAADYELYPLNGIVDGETGWPYSRLVAVRSLTWPSTRRAAVRVTARWGWAAVPAPVKQACLILAAETVKLKDAPFGVAGFGEYGAVRIRQNPIAAGMLAPYNRHPLLVA